jgi:hypothetical protein
MLNDKRYFAEFPDEDPGNQPKLLRSPELSTGSDHSAKRRG